MKKVPMHSSSNFFRFYLVLLILITGVIPSVTSAQTKPAFTEEATVRYDLYYYEDSTAMEGLEHVQERVWTKAPTSNLNFGITQSQFWIKINLYQDVSDELLYLSVNRAVWDSLTFYYYDTTGSIHTCNFGFYFSTPQDRKLNTPFISFNPNEIKNQEIFIKGANRYPLIFPISISSEGQFLKSNLTNTIFQSILIGGLLIIAIYNLFLWFMIKEISYLIYVLNILFTCIIQASLNGYFTYFDLSTSVLSFYSVRSLITLNLILSCVFSLYFIPSLNRNKLFRNAIYTVMILSIIPVLLDYSGLHYISIKLLMLVTMLTAILLMVTGYVFWLKKEVKVAMFFSLAWTLYIIALVIYVLKSNGTISHSWFTDNFVHISKFFETALLSFALGFRYNELKKDKEALQVKLNVELEYLVAQKTESLNKALEEKGILLNEVHHRVKNNLQIINSMLSIQRRRFPDNLKQLISIVQYRIGAISLVHEQLYSDHLFSAVFAKNYLIKLTQALKKGLDNQDLKFELEISPEIVIPIEVAVPFGLMLNEIINNSIKHAFDGVKSPKIILDLKEEENQIILKIADNGVGDQELPTSAQPSTNLGLRIISDMARQLNADMQLKKAGGYQYNFSIPMNHEV